MTLSEQPVCQRPTVQAAAEGVSIQNADLRGVSFSGADLTNSVFASNMLDQTTGFAGTILAGVNFSKENLGRSVDLSGAVSLVRTRPTSPERCCPTSPTANRA